MGSKLADVEWLRPQRLAGGAHRTTRPALAVGLSPSAGGPACRPMSMFPDLSIGSPMTSSQTPAEIAAAATQKGALAVKALQEKPNKTENERLAMPGRNSG